MRLAGRTAIVTGAAGGIGAAVAAAFLDAGAKVLLTDISAKRLAPTSDSLAHAHPGRVARMAGDAASTEHVEALVGLAERELGPVDVYVANAGVGIGAGLDATDEEWEAALGVNLMAHVRAARVVVPQWVERGEGYFVSTASAAGLLTQIGSPTYAASKHAAVAFAEWLSVTYGDKGVRVSCLCPMGVDTHLLAAGEGTLMIRSVTGSGAVISPAEAAEAVVDAMAQERFLVLPHAEVLDMWRGKTADYDRWLRGMRRYQASLEAEG